MKPNFLIIGAPKAGTTSLWDLLRQHPEVSVCHPKEINFFSHDENYAKGWSWYEAAFPGADKAKAVVDVSPAYAQTFRFPEAPRRIAQHLPDATLIYVLRNPIEGIASAYGQCLHTGHPMPRSFRRAVREYPPLLESRRYWRRLSDFRRFFSDEQIEILFFEDFREDPARFLRGLCRLLGVDDSYAFSEVQRPRNAARDHKSPTGLGRLLRRILGVRYVRRHLTPLQLHRTRKLLSRLPPIPFWDPRSLLWVRGELADDTRAILDYAGRPLDYWGP